MARKTPEIIALDAQRLDELMVRAERQAFEPADYETLRTLVAAYGCLTSLLHDKSTTIARLRKMLFGASTEKTAAVLESIDAAVAPPAAELASASAGSSPAQATDSLSDLGAGHDATTAQTKSKRKGHGRKAASAYVGATKIPVPHETLHSGDPCPVCVNGVIYTVKAPQVLVRVVGRAPLDATVYELDRLRCNLCGETFTAEPPAGVGPEKYDATAAAMIGMLKYGAGLPFYRLGRLQEHLQIPLPPATQWDIVRAAAADSLLPAYAELVRQAAQGDLFHNDDTTNRILEFMGRRAKQQAASAEQQAGPTNKDGSPRKGLFTSAIVSIKDDRRIALFFTGRKHAGENLADVLQQRAAELATPLQMCDALSRNVPDQSTIVGNCLSHARRNFVELVDRFPSACRHVLESLRTVYQHDDEARKLGLSKEARLELHQAQSKPVMESLQAWLRQQFDERLVEPNSALGGAIAYCLNHWDKLTLFLRQAGAPLDNNLCEGVLKRPILHRKKALFFLTQAGARVGDLYRSLICTCELAGANPLDYLAELQRRATEVAASPGDWLPWNYRQTLARQAA